MQPRRIGILGGTFDPLHNGHLELARAACEQLQLDRVIFIPAFRHPVKEKSETVASPDARLEMVRLGIRNDTRFEVSDCEIRRKGISYTVDTLRMLREKHAKPHELFFLTGGDWGKNLDEWKEIKTVFSIAHFVVAKRPGFDLRNLPAHVEPLDFVPLDISSSEIRERLRTGRSVSEWIPERVLRYVEEHCLYQS